MFFANNVFKKTNLAQIITLETPKLGPDNNFTAYIYIYVYVCMLWSYYLGQVGPFQGFLSGLSLFLNTVVRNTIKNGVWARKKLRAKNSEAIIWPRWPLLCRNTLFGPDHNPRKWYCFALFALKNVLKYLFYSVFWTSVYCCPKMGENDNFFFHKFAKHRSLKKKPVFIATPNFTKNSFFVTRLFWKINIDVEQRHNLR